MSQQPLQYESAQTAGWTKHEVAVLVVKVLALYCLIKAMPLIGYFPSLIYYVLYETGQGFELLIWATQPAAYLVLAIILWAASGWIAGLLIAAPQGERLVTPPAVELQAIALSVAGALLIVWALAEAAGVLVGGYYTDWMPGYTPTGGLIKLAVQAILGLILFVRGNGIALLWHKIRTAGVEQPGYAERPPSK